jgi:hypothetical protein
MVACGHLLALAALLPGKNLCPQDERFAPQPVWTCWKREESVAAVETRAPDCSALSPLVVPTTLSQFLHVYDIDELFHNDLFICRQFNIKV